MPLAFCVAQDVQDEHTQVQDAGPDVTGTWTWERQGNRNAAMRFTLRLNHKEGRITGTLERKLGDMDLRSVEIEEAKLLRNVISFTVTPPKQDQPPVRYVGTITDDSINGTVWTLLGVNILEREWQANRRLEWTGVLGEWKLAAETPSGNTNELILKLVKEGESVKGTMKSEQFGEFEVSDIEIKSTQLTFTVIRKADGNDVRIDYIIEPRADKLKGSMRFNENPNRVFEFTGERRDEHSNRGSAHEADE
jgi:hypothetical protein